MEYNKIYSLTTCRKISDFLLKQDKNINTDLDES